MIPDSDSEHLEEMGQHLLAGSSQLICVASICEEYLERICARVGATKSFLLGSFMWIRL